jgi:MFS family permease
LERGDNAAVASTARAPFTTGQKRILLALASAVGLRTLGLFLVLPVFTLYGLQFTSSHLLTGVAFGCYGMAVAFTAIPMGRLSDHIGRRKALLLGMSIFTLGSILCAIPPFLPAGWRIGDLIFGRFVQGLGTITSVAFATVADCFPAERRSTGFAVLGIPIGISFGVGVVAGPLISGFFHTQALFWLTGILGMGTLWLLYSNLPDAPPGTEKPAPLLSVVASRPLWLLDSAGLVMNIFMTSFWFFFPLILTRQHHLRLSQFYAVLIPMLLISGVTMFGFSRGADRGASKPLSTAAFLIMAVSSWMLFNPGRFGLNPAHLSAALIPGTLFLIGFTGLEPILPGLVSKTSHQTSYGTAMGAYQTMQYLGSFAGGTLAGAIAHTSPALPMMVMAGASLLGALMMALR